MRCWKAKIQLSMAHCGVITDISEALGCAYQDDNQTHLSNRRCISFAATMQASFVAAYWPSAS